MLIEGNTIIVKSFPENWEVEESGKKANTYREVTDFEWDQHQLDVGNGELYSKNQPIEKIRVINTGTEEQFERTLTNVMWWKLGGNEVLILSWNPGEQTLEKKS